MFFMSIRCFFRFFCKKSSILYRKRLCCGNDWYIMNASADFFENPQENVVIPHSKLFSKRRMNYEQADHQRRKR